MTTQKQRIIELEDALRFLIANHGQLWAVREARKVLEKGRDQ